MFKLSEDQSRVLKKILSWIKSEKSKPQFITVGGYAGTGKTTLIGKLNNILKKENPKIGIAFVSYTGKSSQILSNKLENLNKKQDFIGTIHSLIYAPVVDDNQQIIGWKKKDRIKADLIIIDEASMVDGLIWQHLLSYKIPIIAVGDHGQLPPVNGSFNLMQEPMLILEHIHRQAAKNPIIGISVQARDHGFIRSGAYTESVIKYSKEDPERMFALDSEIENFNKETLFLCGYNFTRKKINQRVRMALGFETQEPVAGDRVICLRNNHKKNIFNGMLGEIIDISMKDKDWYEAEIQMDQGFIYNGLISTLQFQEDKTLSYTKNRKNTINGDLFDFGYALTVHKAQGSEAKKVVLFEERFSKMDDEDWRRWLYTAVTRAREEILIF